MASDSTGSFVTYFRRKTEHAEQSHPSYAPTLIIEDERTGMGKDTIKRAFLDHLECTQGTDPEHASLWDSYMALSYTVRDRLMHRWLESARAIRQHKAKMVCYLSAEFLMGRQLGNSLISIGCFKAAAEALKDLGVNIYDVFEQEAEPGLGNGGLGRLAVCFLDSLATLNMPAFGYGIRYEFGIFEQAIQDGWQVEKPDKWLRFGNPWEIPRPQLTMEVGFGGHTEMRRDKDGKVKWTWVPSWKVLGIPYDIMVPGFNTNLVNTLRLWAAGTSEDFDFAIFNSGDYLRAVEGKAMSENISKVLYPNDLVPQGRLLRLQQQYFFVSCSLQDMIRRHRRRRGSLDTFHEWNVVQLNDTHPAIAVAELMRLLLDVHDMSWERAWYVTSHALNYTNHTLLSEALERWPVSLFGALLPRHLEIIYEINHRFMQEARAKFPTDEVKVSRMSIIEEGTEKKVRMANLATIASHKVNGVAALHTELLKKDVMRDFYEMWPDKFRNVTNGITPRRWLMLCNPKLSHLITERIGRGWSKDLDDLKKLEASADNKEFQKKWTECKTDMKRDLAAYIQRVNGVTVDPTSLFDVQVKRLHEYKRQLLSVMHVIALYNRIKANPNAEILPRTVIFAAKAAPGYFMAKLIIKLINSVAEVVNDDPEVRDRLKLIFMKNFCVSLGERIYPAADLSEQISLAGKEASGTGNMKFALNGALTVGTLDGANIEIRDHVGHDNFFLFGLTVEEVTRMKSEGYVPRAWYQNDEELRGVIDMIDSGAFSRTDRDVFKPIVRSLLDHDEYMHMADFRSYLQCQHQVEEAFRDHARWARMSILNVARIGFFSSDRSIREYCEHIWDVKPIEVIA